MIHCCRLRHRRYSNVMYYPHISSPLTRNLPSLRAIPCPHPQFLLQGLLLGGVLGGLSKAFWGPLGASWAPFGGLWGVLAATLLPTTVSLNDRVTIWSASGGVLGPSGAVSGALLDHLGALLDHIGTLLDCLEAL